MADHLGDFFNSLEEQAKDCSDYSEDVEKLFDTWLMMVAKLHSACEQKLGLASNGNSLSAQISARIQEQGSSHTSQNAKEAAERVKKSLDVAEGNFKQANDAASGRKCFNELFIAPSWANLTQPLLLWVCSLYSRRSLPVPSYWLQLYLS